jgi:ProP effector
MSEIRKWLDEIGLGRFAELYPKCFCQPRQSLKIGIHNDVIARHPELRPNLIASALKTYTRSVGYLETLKAGTPRIDLEGNVAGEVTATDEADVTRKIAKEAGGAGARAIEERKEVAAPPVTQSVSQVEHVAPTPTEPRSESAPVAALPSSPADRSGRTKACRVGWPQGGRTGSPGKARRREVIQAPMAT